MPVRGRPPLLMTLILAGASLLAACSASPFAAQPPKPLPKVGVLCGNCPVTYDGPVPPNPSASVLVEGLRVLGYVDGETVTLLWRGAGGQNERLPALAQELVGQQVDVIVTLAASPGAAAAKQATTIPIVFVGVGDPIGSGFVESFPRPGGNMTGLSNYSPETVGKRLEQLKEVAPGIKRVGALYSLANPSAAKELQEAQTAASRLGLTLEPWDVRNLADVEAAFQTRVSPPPDALFFSGEPFLSLNRKRLLELVAERRLPATYNLREWAMDGGLISYGFNLQELNRGSAAYVDRILKGTPPGEIPVQLPTKFDFVVNLNTARGLGLTIPGSILSQATEVVE